MGHRTKCKTQNSKTFRRKHRQIFLICVRQRVLRYDIKTQSIKEKIDKLDFHQNKKDSALEKINLRKRQAINWKKTCKSHI